MQHSWRGWLGSNVKRTENDTKSSCWTIYELESTALETKERHYIGRQRLETSRCPGETLLHAILWAIEWLVGLWAGHMAARLIFCLCAGFTSQNQQ
eukprot:scaffold126257_cov15-Prasinocladus_malaysianus.AAC.1